jgi:hypothetical protein
LIKKRLAIGLTAGFGIILILVLSAWVLPQVLRDQQIEAPEAARVLETQRELPFQLLIPAYLPHGFERAGVEIQTGQAAPDGEPMTQLVYSHPRGVTLTLSQWMPAITDAPTSSAAAAGVQPCTCMCSQSGQCSPNMLMIDSGPVRVMAETSDAAILSPEHVRVILTTLAPAGGLLTYTTLDEVPLTAGLPPAEEIPVNENGVQEVVLVISSSGYTPVHFSVKKDIPVRLVFRQLGEVGCGNELHIQWGEGQTGFLSLLNPTDSAFLEFTPQETGDFLFHCSHFIYQGVMTVVE